MGTQFWWFYDVLMLSVTAGIFYAAVARGFNKGVFRLFGFLLTIVLSMSISNALKGMVYQNLFQQKITETIAFVLEDEEWDMLTNASETLAFTAAEEDTVPDADAFLEEHKNVQTNGGSYPEWFVTSVCNVIETAVSAEQKPHAEQSLAAIYENDPEGLCSLVDAIIKGDVQGAAAELEGTFYRPPYLQMIRMVLLLMIQLVMLVICSIIFPMAGNLEEQMHIRKGDHILGVPIGLAEAADILLVMVVVVRLIVALTDGQMLLFNPETIEQTKLFQYIYRIL